MVSEISGCKSRSPRAGSFSLSAESESEEQGRVLRMKDDDTVCFCLFLPIFFFLESVFLAPFVSMPVGRRAMSMLIHGVELGNVTELVELSSANFTVFKEVSRNVMLEREDPFYQLGSHTLSLTLFPPTSGYHHELQNHRPYIAATSVLYKRSCH